MSGPVLAAGVGCSGPPDHATREWVVDSGRRLRVIGDLRPEVRHGLSLPIPGAARPLAVDPWRFIVLFNDSNAVCLDGPYGRVWRPLGKEAEVKLNEVFVAAGALCAGGFWTVDPERNIGTWSPTGRSPIGTTPVPGTSPIIAVDAANSTVLLADGGRFAWTGGGWHALPGLLDEQAAPGLMKVRVVNGFSLGGGRDLNAGDIVEMDEAEARRYMRDHRVEYAPVGAGDQ